MTKNTNANAPKKDRMQAVLERQQQHLRSDKLCALMVSALMFVGIAGLG